MLYRHSQKRLFLNSQKLNLRSQFVNIASCQVEPYCVNQVSHSHFINIKFHSEVFTKIKGIALNTLVHDTWKPGRKRDSEKKLKKNLIFFQFQPLLSL